MPDGYIEPVYKALEHYTSLFEKNETYKNLPTILVGDFNFGVEFDDSFLKNLIQNLKSMGLKRTMTK